MDTLRTETNREILHLMRLIIRRLFGAIQVQVQSLRRRGIDLNTPYIGVREGHRNITALCCAAFYAQGFGIEIPRFLIQNGADVNKGDADNFTPLHFACINSEDSLMVEFLVGQGAKLWIRNADGNRPQDVIGHGGDGYAINIYLREQTQNLRRQAYRWLLNGWNPQLRRRYPLRRRNRPRRYPH